MKHIFKKTSLSIALILSLSGSAIAESAGEYIANIGKQANIQGLERVRQILVAPPFLPKHKQKWSGKSRIIEMEV